ncbi:MAG: aminoglycoside phosphotransferase family protein [Phormidium tanganyikae FI6-MK23]|jgi:Ser/Thr protein kinase RdoA (MazF antagonist)|nr:aminoglycoside phosphotransferase family protein [Phormidium tanganyikae FI6-MK23]
MTQSQDSLNAIANQFAQGSIKNIQPFGSGNINDTFLVTLEASQFVLQRINTQVFRQPEHVMKNIYFCTQHIHDRLSNFKLDRRWETPQVIFTHENQDHHIDENGLFWRALSFIKNSRSHDTIQNLDHAEEIGYALGTFHSLISDLPPERLTDTLEGFHITPIYLQQYKRVLSETTVKPSPEVNYCLKFIRDRQSWAHVLENAKHSGKLSLRLMHGDPKVNNILIDSATEKAVSVIDLDTVKPGLIHYDIGDCLRSGCNAIGEETEQWETVRFEPDLCEGILRGYLTVAKAFLTDSDYLYLFDAIRLITFELGLRFFTDYLAGNIYFKTTYPEHNLMRALVQFGLTKSIESQELSIRSIIEDLR